jgi:hypothetical protein
MSDEDETLKRNPNARHSMIGPTGSPTENSSPAPISSRA